MYYFVVFNVYLIISLVNRLDSAADISKWGMRHSCRLPRNLRRDTTADDFSSAEPHWGWAALGGAGLG